MKRLALILVVLVALPGIARAANPDLSITADEIRFSKEVLIAGDTIRLYARIRNVGDEDMVGYATFFQGNAVLGNSQVISVLAGGVPEEVFIDFIVPAGSFNIRAEIRGTDPPDVNPENDTAITPVFEPVFDVDHDGIADAQDNCPDIANAEQTDSDADGAGDACDSDDDDDGLSDSVESELGTSPVMKDTDGDGVADPDDAYPTDPTRQVKPEPEPPKKTFAQVVEEVAQTIKKEQKESSVAPTPAPEMEEPSVEAENENTADEMTLPETGIAFSPNAAFAYTRDAWDTFTFRVSGASDDMHYEWDFGDGVRSNKTEVTHTYQRSGAYRVILALQDAEGHTSSEHATVLVPFFSLHNRFVVGLVALLLILLGAGGFALWKFRPND